jgi:CRISPR/Cas system-associated endonuclease Cas3-HD
MHNFCHPEAKLETLALPSTLKMEDRERFEEVKKAESVSTMIHNMHRALMEELQAHCFTFQLHMSKQMDAKGMLTNEQYELARNCTLYMQCLRKANNIVQLPTREILQISPRKKQKMGGPSLFHGP